MSLQDNVQTTLAYKAETTFGVAAGASGAQYLRRVSLNMNTNKDSFASQEARTDYQVSDMRHGGISSGGSLSGELSTESYDDFFEAALRGTWTAGVSASPSDFATGVTVATSGGNSTLTFAGAGSLLTKGFKIGDVIRTTGLTATANNGRNWRIIALTATVMTVAGVMTAQAQQAAGWTVAVAGGKLTMGTQKRSFTLEQALADASVYELFTGVRVGGFSIGVQPNGMTSVNWELMGKNGAVSGTEYFSSVAAETNTGILSGIDGALRLNGAERAVVTGLQVNFTNNLSMSPVIGSVTVPEIFYGRMVCTGTVSAYLDSTDLLDAFINEEEIDLVAQLEASGSEPQAFLAFNMQRVKLSSGTKTIGPDGGVIAQFPFQALLKTGGSGTAYDQSTLTIQRSNAVA